MYFATLKKLYDGIFMLQYISIHWNVIGNLMKNATWLLSMYAGLDDYLEILIAHMEPV